MRYTSRFAFTTLDTAIDRLDALDNKFGGADRLLIDQLLAYAVEAHVHNGTMLTTVPPPPPQLTTKVTGGTLLPNSTIYYKYAIVNDHGQLGIASTMAVGHTPGQLAPPDPPQITQRNGGLLGGNYVYALSAYTGTENQETTLSASQVVNLAGGGGWTITLPALPTGATGFNLYRQGPGDIELQFLTSLVSVFTFDDIGLVAPNSRRLAPTTNTSFTANTITVSVPDLPVGATVRIYRTYDPTSWERSLVEWVSTANYVDTGRATQTGVPSASSSGVGGAPKIILGLETEGVLPPDNVILPLKVELASSGPVTVGIGSAIWVNEHSSADVIDMRLSLAPGSAPASQPVQARLQRASEGGPWVDLTSIYLEIPVGAQVSPVFTPPPVAARMLHTGDALRVSVLQDGGGATRTDFDLLVTLHLMVAHGSGMTYVWKST